MASKQLPLVYSKVAGQAMIEYFASIIVASLIVTSLFLLIPGTLESAYNNVFNNVYLDLMGA